MSDIESHGWSELPEEQVGVGIHRRAVHGRSSTIAQVRFDEGAIVPMHEHHHEQTTLVQRGALRLTIGREHPREVVLRAGQLVHIPAGAPHEAVALEATEALDFFAPAREDWLVRDAGPPAGSR